MKSTEQAQAELATLAEIDKIAIELGFSSFSNLMNPSGPMRSKRSHRIHLVLSSLLHFWSL